MPNGAIANGTRVIALVGPAGAGKTSLAEAMLFASGTTDRQGSTDSGSSIGDSSPEARARGGSTELNLLNFDYLGEHFAIVDVPGSIGFAADGAHAVDTFSGFMHFIRLFGGEVGVAAMTRFLSLRQKFHSNMLGLHVETGSWLTDERIRMLSGGVLPASTGPEEALSRAVRVLEQQVRAQAYTMAVADGFILIGWMVVAYLLLMLLLRPAKISFKDIRRMQ